MLRNALVIGAWILATLAQSGAAAESAEADSFDVWSLAFSADDQFLAAGGGGGYDKPAAGQTRIWDFGRAKEIASFPTITGLGNMALSPDGRRVALCRWSGYLTMNEVGGGELMHEKFDSHVQAAFSPDGKLMVAVTEGAQLRCWDGTTGKPLETEQDAFRGDLFPFFWVGFSPNGKYLVACGGHGDEVEGVKFAVWSVESRRQLYKKSVNLDRTLAPLKRPVIFSASISPDSQTLATNGENSVALWDLATGVRRNEMEATDGLVYRVEFSPAGKLLASVNYEPTGAVTLWDSSTGKVVGSLTGHEDYVRALAFTHDGKTLATGGADWTVRLWDVAARQQKDLLLGPDVVSNADRVAAASSAPPATNKAQPPAALPAPAEKPTSTPQSPQATTVAFERDPVQLQAGAFDIWSLSFSGDDQFLAAGGGGGGRWDDKRPGQARIWDFGKAKEVASYPTMRGIQNVALSPDGRRVVLCSWSGDVWLHEVGGVELMHERFSHPVWAAFSPDGKLLVGVTELRELRTWDGVTGKSIEEGKGAFQGGTFRFLWAGFSPDGKYLVTAGGKKNESDEVKFAVWSVASRKQLYKTKVDLDRIESASISPDSQTLATGGEKSVALWDLASGVRRSETEETGSIVNRVEFSPDGELLASAGDESSGVVTLWHPSTGKAVGKLTGHENTVLAMAFTRDGKTLATGGRDQTLRLWDVATGQQTSILQGPNTAPDAAGAIVAVAYSPDGGSMATASEDGWVSVYGPAPRGLSRAWLAHADAAAALAFSPDGKTLATAGFDRLVKVWNPATGELIRTLSGHTGAVVSLAISRDGQTLASGSNDRSIRLWNVADGLLRQTLSGHTATIRSLAFSHDNKLLASASTDRTVRLWNPASGAEQASLAGHLGAVRAVAFSADDRLLASGSEDQTVKVWDVAARDLHGTLTGHTDIVSAVAFAQQALISASWDRTLRTWDADALESRSKITVGRSEVVAMAVAPHGRHLLSAGADQSLTLWKSTMVEGQRSGPLGQYRSFPWTAEFSPDGGSVAVAAGGAGDETDLHLYDVATTAEKNKVSFPGSVRSIAFAPAGDLLALGFAKRRVLLVDAATGREVAELEKQPADVPPHRHFRSTRVAFSADGKLLASSSYDDDIRIYDVERRALVKTLKGQDDKILSLAFSPDRKRLVSCSSGKPAVVWDLESDDKQMTLSSPPGYHNVASVSFSPDGKLIATGYGTDICCFCSADTGSVLQTFKAHLGIVFEAVFSPDGKLLATCGDDGLVKLWEVPTGELLRTYDCESERIFCVRFSPDGKSFVTTPRNGQVRLWWVLPPETK